MSNYRVWLFRVLVLAAIGLMLLSWFMPWWAADVLAITKNAVVIHPWGLEEHLGSEASQIAGSEMSAFFAPAMWIYLGLCIAALLFSLFAKNKELKVWKFRFTLPSFIIGLVGLSYIVVVVLAVIIAAIRTGDFWQLPLIGHVYIDQGEPYQSFVDTGLLLGYWLACVVGPLLIVLALIRNKIIGYSQTWE